MLQFFDQQPNSNRNRFTRRDFLRIGGLGLGGLSLPALLQTQLAAKAKGIPVRDKSIIFLFMHGGPSQTETFDPKMDASANIRSATGEVATAIPGVTFGGTFPKLAALAKKFSIVRSFVTGDGNHDIKPIVGRDTLGANLGSIYSRIVGTSNPTTGIPTNVALFPQAVVPESQPRQAQFGKFDATGPFGAGYAPFIPGAGGDLQSDMQLQLPLNRLDDRRTLLQQLDNARFHLESMGGLDRIREQAFGTILGGVAGAFDLSKEDPGVVQRYDTAKLVHAENISRQWNNHKYYVDNGQTLGKLLLLARRVCEAGCGFVTVTTNFVWDMHSDQNNAGVQEGMQYCGLPFDHAVSAFIEDIEARGLSEKIMLVCCGEMGRTPKINGKGGRDHWGGIAPLMIYGGGLQMGRVIGQSDREGGRPASEPIYIKDLISTIMHTLFDLGELRLVQGLPQEIVQLINNGSPIAGLI
jgi:hypothetical protein